MLTMLKRAASAVLTPAAGKVTVFVDDVGVPSYKDEAGNTQQMSWEPPKGYIDGLKLEWVSGTQVRVTPGAAYVPGPKRIAELAAAVTLTPSLAASTWYHAYLTVVSGVVSAEASTVAPAAPYTGTARTKTGDTSRRYIGSFLTSASGAILNFLQQGDQQLYMEPIAASLSGTSTTFVAVSLAAFVPSTSRLPQVQMANGGTAVVRFRPASSGYTGTNRMYGLVTGAQVVGVLPTDASQQIEYNVDAGGVANLTVLGFTNQR